ncbi:unnamed protein product, partial [Rotaria magnacalcarata]
NITGFGNCYGYVYKFQRCAILHKFLFYLIYGYEGKVDTEPLQVRMLKSILSQSHQKNGSSSEINSSLMRVD